MFKKSLKNKNIEFCRGLAVILVFFFHYNTKLFTSLFVGVDIFFLISGYVITLSVFNKEKFEISTFYLRRIKRIFPNLIFILTFFIFTYFFFYNEFYKDFEINFFSTIFSFFGISNLYYSLNPNLFYFSDEIKWLIHTWSLSVEIQFYIIFGLAIFLYYRFFKKNDFDEKFFKLFLLIITLISLFLFIFSEIRFISDYYSLPGRIWEFALGSSIYFLRFKKKFSFNFLILIFLTLLFLMNLSSLPEKIIIIFSVTYFFLVFLTSKDLNDNQITNIFRFFGRISYSFYLWHLILISFLKNYFDLLILDFIFIFLVTTIFSIVSYYLIEVSFNKALNFDYFLKKGVLGLSLISPLFLVYIFLFNENFINKSFNSLNKYSINFFHFLDNNSKFLKQNNDIVQYRYDKCENKFEVFNFSKKVNCINYQQNSTLIYLLGNSYADHLVPAISEVFSEYTIYNARFENCYVSDAYNCQKNELDIIINQYLKISKNYKKKIIIISLNNKKFSKTKIQKFIGKIKNEYTEIIITYPHPSIRVISDKEKFKNYNQTKKEEFEFLKKNFNIAIFDIFENICDNCNLKKYQNYFIEDGSHFNLNGSLSLVSSMKKLIRDKF